MSDTTNVLIIPGPPGEDGIGYNGSDGGNGYSLLTDPFIMPAALGSASATVDSTAWMSIGVYIYVATLGYLQVGGITDDTHVALTNTGYSVNAAPGTVAPVSSVLCAAGPTGSDGTLTGAAGGVLSGTYPDPDFAAALLSARGDLISHNGTSPLKQALGAASRLLKTNPGVGSGLQWAQADLTTDVTGVLPEANGGTGQATFSAALDAGLPLTTAGDILYRGAAANLRLPIGTDGQVLTVDTVLPGKLKYATPATPSMPLAPVQYIMTATPYTVLATVQYVGVRLAVAGASVINLMSGSLYNGSMVVIKDETGDAGSNNITVQSLSGETFEGAGVLVLSTNRQVVRLLFTGVEWQTI